MMKLMSASKLAVVATKRKPKGLPATEAGICAMCGIKHEVGELVNPEQFADTFTNYNDLASPGSGVICGYCFAVMESEPKPFLSKEERKRIKEEKEYNKKNKIVVDKGLVNPDFSTLHSTACITEKGVFRFQKSAHVAFWLKNPPKTPFVMMMKDQMRQHLLFRTPVNYNNKVFQVRVGSKMVTIRHAHLMKAEEACYALSDMYMEYIAEGPKKKKVTPGTRIFPFMHLDRDMNKIVGMQIRGRFYEMAEQKPEAKPLLDVLHQCLHGELWGLAYLLTTKGEKLEAVAYEFKPA